MSTATATKPVITNKNTEIKSPEVKENIKMEAVKQEEVKAVVAEVKAITPEIITTEVVEFPQARYDELHTRFSKFLLNDSEEKEYFTLRKMLKESVQGRLTAIAEAVSLITKNKLSISDLVDAGAYKVEDVKSEAAAYFPNFNKSKNKPEVADGDDSEKTTQVAKDYGLKLIKIKVAGKKGKGTTVAKDTPFPAATLAFGANFAHVKAMTGDIAANLKSFAIKSPEAEEFLNTEDGHAFITKWAGYISRSGKKA